MPALPKTPPLGVYDSKKNAEVLREIVQYLQLLPSVEQIRFEGVLSLPLDIQVETRQPVYVSLNGRSFPAGTEPVVEVLGISWRWLPGTDGRGSTIRIESINDLSEGSAYTLTGVCVGER